MSLDPRRSGVALWIAWVVAGTLGGSLATMLVLAGMGGLLSAPNGIGTLAYLGTFSAVAALYQFLLLLFVAPGRRAALLWLPATMAGIYFWLNVPWFLPSPAGLDYLYSLGLGAAQGLVLFLVARRWAALPLWVLGNLLAWPVSDYFAHPYVGPLPEGATLVASSALTTGAYAAVTGLALILVFRRGRPSTARTLPKATAELQGEG